MSLFECTLCDKIFDKIGKLEEHERTHTGERPFGCRHPYCDAAFYTERHLKRHHLAVHEVQPKVKCPECGVKLKSAAGITRHLREFCKVRNKEAIEARRKPKGPKPKPKIENGGVGKVKACEECDMLVSWTEGGGKKEMDAHMATHGGYPCTQCAPVTRFKTYDNLCSHIRGKHNPEGPQLCGLCGKVYSSKANLITHIRNVHEGKSECCCPTCGQSFSKVPNLKRHMKESCGKDRRSSRATTPSTPTSDNSEVSCRKRKPSSQGENTEGTEKRRKTNPRGEYVGALIAQFCGTTVKAVREAEQAERAERILSQ